MLIFIENNVLHLPVHLMKIQHHNILYHKMNRLESMYVFFFILGGKRCQREFREKGNIPSGS